MIDRFSDQEVGITDKYGGVCPVDRHISPGRSTDIAVCNVQQDTNPLKSPAVHQ
jgi:hypothetical protein